MRDDQRRFLLADFQEFVNDARAEASSRDKATISTDHPTDPYVERFVLAIDWLRGDRPADAELLRFFEGRLTIFERELNYKPIAFEREALAAAVEALR